MMFAKTTVAVVLSLVVVHADNHVSTGMPEVLVGYMPKTDVRDQARIDLDQKAIEFCLEGSDVPDFACAQAMYEDGAHSKSVSTITIGDATGLPADIMQATKLMGMNADGTAVMVFVQGDNATVGDTTMNVQYVNEGCYVGANTVPVLTGCLAPAGNLTVDGGNVTFSYSYDPNTTANVYDIQGFTLSSEYRFVEGGNLTTDFQKFVDFYGSESYADDIMMAALTGTSTAMPTGKDLDMSAVDESARIEVAVKTTSYMAIWMYVIRELEHAIYLCETGDCGEESCLGKAAVHEVDEAVAFYAGSLEGPEGSEDGLLPYRFAQKRAENFKTMGENGDEVEGTAKVNIDVINLFTQALEHILAADCAGLREDTTAIVNKMKVPFIQGTMRYVYFTDVLEDATDKSAGELAIFAAGVLPFVAACNTTASDLIYEHTKIGKTETDLPLVKAAFESQYECMGVSGDDVGGLWDAANGMYFEGMEPMGYVPGEEGGEGEEDEGEEGGEEPEEEDSTTTTSGAAIGSIRAALLGVIASVIYTSA